MSVQKLFCILVAWEMKLSTKLVLMISAILINLLHLKLCVSVCVCVCECVSVCECV